MFDESGFEYNTTLAAPTSLNSKADFGDLALSLCVLPDHPVEAYSAAMLRNPAMKPAINRGESYRPYRTISDSSSRLCAILLWPQPSSETQIEEKLTHLWISAVLLCLERTTDQNSGLQSAQIVRHPCMVAMVSEIV